jgi:hypothetical protein
MIKTNIVLVALFDLTETYWQIAQKFSDVMNVYYVTSTQVTFNWLVTNGVEKACILDLSQTRRQVRALGEASQELLSQIRDFERFGPTFTSIIMMSRFYRGEDSDCLIHYMGQTALRLEEFFLCNNIEWVLAEPTNAVELLAYQVCKKHNIAVGQLCFPRLPTGRIILFKDIAEQEYYPLLQITDAEGAPASSIRKTVAAWLRAYRKNPERPAYFKSQLISRSPIDLLKAAIRRLGSLIKELYGGTEINSSTFWDQIELYGRRYLGRLHRYDLSEQANGHHLQKPIVYFLQVQPERSVDVEAPFYSNQLELIKNIRRATPCGHRLLVKDHPSKFGMQPLAFYRELAKIPGVKLIEGSYDSRKLIRSAAFVATVCGTVAFEAALLNVPALIFSKVFFRKLPLVYECESLSGLSELVPRVISRAGHNPETSELETLEFLTDIWLNSVVSDWDGTGHRQPDAVIESFIVLISLAIAANKS